MSDTLDEWESDAKEQQSNPAIVYCPKEFSPYHKILALIRLVRAKDEALKFSRAYSTRQAWQVQDDALALTEELK